VIKLNFGQGRLSLLITVVFSIVIGETALSRQTYALPALVAERSSKKSPENSTPKSFTCPNNLPKLTTLLLKDLPGYSNRIIQRTQNLNQAAGTENYIITADEAEFKPLTLPRLQYDPIDRDRDPKQVFFTVLERQYIEGQVVEIQTYHWLFLTQTNSGWRTVILFSRFGNANDNQPPAPPQETTDGIIGSAVQLWLRDCHAGAVRS
jgi:hypothetical protein